MRNITIEITSHPEGKKLSGIYLNGELVSSTSPYKGTLPIGTLAEQLYSIEFRNGGSRNLNINSESPDISKIILGYNNILSPFKISYSTNTMASSIRLNMTTVLPQGYQFDEYNDGSAQLSTDLDYTYTIDYSKEDDITITVKTTPLWTWNVTLWDTRDNTNLDSTIKAKAIVSSDAPGANPMTIGAGLRYSSTDATAGWNVTKDKKVIEIGTSSSGITPAHYMIEINPTNFLGRVGVNGYSGAIPVGEKSEITLPPIKFNGAASVKGTTLNNALSGWYVPMGTLRILPSIATKRTAEVRGTLSPVTVSIPAKTSFIYLSTANSGYSDGTKYITISSSGSYTNAAWVSVSEAKYGGDTVSDRDNDKVFAILTDGEGTFAIRVSTTVTGDSAVTFKLTTASLSVNGGTSVYATSVQNNVATFGPETMARILVSTYSYAALAVAGEYVYKSRALKVQSEATDVRKCVVDGIPRNLPYSTKVSIDS